MSKPPRLVARTLAVTFITVAIILSVVFIVLTLDARDRVRTSETDKLRVAGQIFTALETRRQQDQLASIATLAENPTLKAALDTYFTESRFYGLAPDQEQSLRDTVSREIDKLAALGSFWLARTLSEPIDRLAGEVEVMTAAHDLRRTLPPTGSSRELDALTTTFNELIRGLAAAEAESRAAYLGAIHALAAALDARDPYTAGHSERVSALSVTIGRQMHMTEPEIDVLRLGALLHDIGKIGLSDEILRKPGPLTPEEFEQIKRHPALGARILRQVPFLAPHLPIVELHHERPDGRGYPFGLRGDEIPVAARIVHVADAFDAMTSARAYRPARAHGVAAAELQRFSGTQFDSASVDALLAALPSATTMPERALQELLGRQLA